MLVLISKINRFDSCSSITEYGQCDDLFSTGNILCKFLWPLQQKSLKEEAVIVLKITFILFLLKNK